MIEPITKKLILEEEQLPEGLGKLFFEVDERPLYWEVSSPFTVNPDVKLCEPNFYAIVDMEKNTVFSAVTQGYLLITNKEAYDFGKEIGRRLFHLENDGDLKSIHAELSTNRAVCMIDLRRKIDLCQPLMNEGWCAFMRIVNSYNKTRKLEYIIGFYNVEHKYGFLDNSIAISANTAHYSKFGSYQMDIIRQIKEKGYNVEQVELYFLSKIEALRKIPISKESILPMFCHVFGITKTKVAQPQRDSLINTKDYIEEHAAAYTDKYGQNAYALLNVFADYEYKYDASSLRFLLRKDQFKLGKWVDDLINASKAPTFSITRYISEKAHEAAEWLRTLNEEKSNTPYQN